MICPPPSHGLLPSCPHSTLWPQDSQPQHQAHFSPDHSLVGCCPVYCERVSAISSCYLLAATSILPHCRQQQCLQTLPDIPWEAKSPPVTVTGLVTSTSFLRRKPDWSPFRPIVVALLGLGLLCFLRESCVSSFSVLTSAQMLPPHRVTEGSSLTTLTWKALPAKCPEYDQWCQAESGRVGDNGCGVETSITYFSFTEVPRRLGSGGMGVLGIIPG